MLYNSQDPSLLRPHQCESEGGRKRGVLVYCTFYLILNVQ